jgi:hypothetical protein
VPSVTPPGLQKQPAPAKPSPPAVAPPASKGPMFPRLATGQAVRQQYPNLQTLNAVHQRRNPPPPPVPPPAAPVPIQAIGPEYYDPPVYKIPGDPTRTGPEFNPPYPAPPGYSWSWSSMQNDYILYPDGVIHTM